MKKLKLEVNGTKVEGYAAQAGGTLWIHVDGTTFTVGTEQRSRRGHKAAGANVKSGEILAPMPGKIIKTMAKPGDTVEAGQVLLIMEAMKMEYTLKAQAAGSVKEINCEAGQQVALGQLLARLELK